jgi:hypothetical protein
MGIFDAFTGKAATNAAGAMMGQLQTGWNNAGNALSWGGDSGRGVLQNEAIPTIQGGYNDAMNALRGMYGTASGYARDATAAWDPMIQRGQTGTDAYMAAMGLGPQGAEGMNNFRNTPGYEFARDQGLDAINRTAAARGMLAGGNTSADLMKYGTGLADQTYGNYLTRLNPLMEMYNKGISGQVQGLTNQANLATGQGTAEANLYTGRGNNIGNVYGKIAGSYEDEGNARARHLMSLAEKMGEAQAGGIMGKANAQAGALQSGLNLVGQIAGFGTGGGGTLGTDALAWLKGGVRPEMRYG